MSAGDKRRMGSEPLSLPTSRLKGFLLFVVDTENSGTEVLLLSRHLIFTSLHYH